MAEATAEMGDSAHTEAMPHGGRGLLKYLWSTDHKIIARQYLFTGMFMALVGGFMAYVFRMQLAFPGTSVPGFGVVSAGEYNALVTNHGSIMIFWVAMPVLLAAFGNLLIPLMIGADDMVFPRINRLSYQVFFVSAVVILASLFVSGRRLRRGVDGLPATVLDERVQPDRPRLDALADRRGPWSS